MRKDFDYVNMSDYAADMADVSGQAANIIANLTQELAEVKRDHGRLLAAAVMAAGGRLEITDSHMIKAQGLTLTTYRDESVLATVLFLESRSN